MEGLEHAKQLVAMFFKVNALAIIANRKVIYIVLLASCYGYFRIDVCSSVFNRIGN